MGSDCPVKVKGSFFKNSENFIASLRLRCYFRPPCSVMRCAWAEQHRSGHCELSLVAASTDTDRWRWWSVLSNKGRTEGSSSVPRLLVTLQSDKNTLTPLCTATLMYLLKLQ
jgi:hypothetical protein